MTQEEWKNFMTQEEWKNLKPGDLIVVKHQEYILRTNSFNIGDIFSKDVFANNFIVIKSNFFTIGTSVSLAEFQVYEKLPKKYKSRLVLILTDG